MASKHPRGQETEGILKHYILSKPSTRGIVWPILAGVFGPTAISSGYQALFGNKGATPGELIVSSLIGSLLGGGSGYLLSTIEPDNEIRKKRLTQNVLLGTLLGGVLGPTVTYIIRQ